MCSSIGGVPSRKASVMGYIVTSLGDRKTVACKAYTWHGSAKRKAKDVGGSIKILYGSDDRISGYVVVGSLILTDDGKRGHVVYGAHSDDWVTA